MVFVQIKSIARAVAALSVDDIADIELMFG